MFYILLVIIIIIIIIIIITINPLGQVGPAKNGIVEQVQGAPYYYYCYYYYIICTQILIKINMIVPVWVALSVLLCTQGRV